MSLTLPSRSIGFPFPSRPAEWGAPFRADTSCGFEEDSRVGDRAPGDHDVLGEAERSEVLADELGE